MHFNTSKEFGETDEAFDQRVKAWIEGLDQESDGSIVLPLEWPKTFTFKGSDGNREEELAELKLRRPTGADRRAIKLSDQPTKILLDRLARLTGLTDKQVDALDEADLDRAELVIGNFS